jgi:hypothetical protein
MTHEIDLDEPRFPLDIVAHAAGRSIHLLRKWQTGGLSLTGPDGKGQDIVERGRGRIALYTLRTTIRLALMAEMTAWGVPAETAYLTAIQFTDLSDGPPAGYAGRQAERSRDPGECFPIGKTWIVFHNQQVQGEVVNVRDDSPFRWPAPDTVLDITSIFVIDCEILVRRVRDRLVAKVIG